MKIHNVYTTNIPKITTNKFIYADELEVVAQDKLFEKIENALSKDLVNLKRYFNK